MANWIYALSWTLLYSLGQGIIVYAGLQLLLKMLADAPARTRYNASLGAIGLLAAWFGLTLWQQLQQSAALFTADTAVYHIYWFTEGITTTARSSWAERAMPWVGAFYITGLLAMVVRLVSGTLQLAGLRRSASMQADEQLNDLLPVLKQRLNIAQGVRLLQSAQAKVPMVIGILRPIILLPAAITSHLSMAQLETIVLHELAHIKRYDFLINILQTIIETVLFFNPFVWLVSANIRREREFCCDEMVVQHTGTPQVYATALYTLATAEIQSSLAIAASPSPNYLLNRIKRIMETKKNSFSYSRMIAAVLVVAGIAGSIAWLSPGLGTGEKDKPAKAATAGADTDPSRPVQPYSATPSPAPAARPAPPAAPADATKPAPPAPPAPPAKPAEINEQEVLAKRLMADKLVNEATGFLVERNQQELLINGKALQASAATRYLNGLKQPYMRIQVHSLEERIKMHPDANMMQLIFPETFQSGCIDNGPQSGKKEGC